MLARLAVEVTRLGDRRILVAADGVDGSGKSTFAVALAESLEGLGRPVILIRADSFLNLSQVVTGWAAGRQSASGWRATTIRR